MKRALPTGSSATTSATACWIWKPSQPGASARGLGAEPAFPHRLGYCVQPALCLLGVERRPAAGLLKRAPGRFKSFSTCEGAMAATHQAQMLRGRHGKCKRDRIGPG